MTFTKNDIDHVNFQINAYVDINNHILLLFSDRIHIRLFTILPLGIRIKVELRLKTLTFATLYFKEFLSINWLY